MEGNNEYPPDLSEWCLISRMREYPETLNERQYYWCFKRAVHRWGQKARIGMCGRLVSYVTDEHTSMQQIVPHPNTAPCAKAMGAGIITLLAPEFMDVPEAYYIE